MQDFDNKIGKKLGDSIRLPKSKKNEDSYPEFDNNRLILIPVIYIIITIKDINCWLKVLILFVKIISLKSPILNIYFPRGYV